MSKGRPLDPPVGFVDLALTAPAVAVPSRALRVSGTVCVYVCAGRRRSAGGGRTGPGGDAPPRPLALPLRSECRSSVFHGRACVPPGTGGGRPLLPLTAAAMAAGHMAVAGPGSRTRLPVAARFFFLLKRASNPAGPRPGQASLRSVRQRTLDMALSARIGTAQEGSRKKKCRRNRPLSWPGAEPHVLLPAATAGTGGQGEAQAPGGAPLQHTALRNTP